MRHKVSRPLLSGSLEVFLQFAGEGCLRVWGLEFQVYEVYDWFDSSLVFEIVSAHSVEQLRVSGLSFLLKVATQPSGCFEP